MQTKWGSVTHCGMPGGFFNQIKIDAALFIYKGSDRNPEQQFVGMRR